LAFWIAGLSGAGYAWAEEKLETDGFWAGGDIGAGFLHRSLAEDDTKLFLGIKGGYTLHPQLWTGLELSGWLIEASDNNNSFKGQGIRQVFWINRFYPGAVGGFFAKAGGGYVTHWNNKLPGRRREDGWGIVLGVGYDLALSKDFAITPIISYSHGKTSEFEHNVLTLSLGITLQ